ncbi:MAG TPA: hypothetical protein PLZ51_22815, partial [Aggregatilineales bacterium]|nr:hypothetical protein [Aggregatilineales bacterium]
MSGLGVIWIGILIFSDLTLWHYWLMYSLPLGGIASLTVQGLIWLNDWYLYQVTWDNSLRIRER